MKYSPVRTCLSIVIAACLINVFAEPVDGQIAILRNPAPRGSGAEYEIQNVRIDAGIQDQVATVQMAQTFKNTSSRTLETQFLFPLPDDAAVNGLTLVVDGKELPGELKRKEQARAEYEAIVRRQRDPALLEFVGQGLFRTSVFPVPPGQTRRVEIQYTQLLNSDFGLVDFTLPLGTVRHCEKSVEQVQVTVRINSKSPLQNVYSPTHEFDIDRPTPERAICQVTLNQVKEPDDVRLLYAADTSDVGMSLVSYQPEDDQQGYFLLMARPQMKVGKQHVLPKSVVFVVDRSGSMSGEKLRQAQASLKYMINSLNPKDTFNIVSYSSAVQIFRPELEEVTQDTQKQANLFVDDIYAGGGTNINEALTAALGLLQDAERPNYVLFLTDGLPTVGVTSEKEIAANVDAANLLKARVFSFGVGYDVNSRLLDRLSDAQRGTSVFVKPEEDIEVAATNLFQKVSSPAMTDLNLNFVAEKTDGNAVNRLLPNDLPDLFRGEQLLVVGRYRKSGPVTIELSGRLGKKSRTLNHEAQFGDAANTRRNSFVEVLWATRRIGHIINELDLHGKNKELIDELVTLSLEHGIMTPYTSFLADENVTFENVRELMTEAEGRTSDLSIAGGYGGFKQREFKDSLRRAQIALSGSSGGYGADVNAPSDAAAPAAGRSSGRSNLSRAARSLSAPAADDLAKSSVVAGGQEEAKSEPESEPQQTVRRIGSRTFYWKNDEWQDSELAEQLKDIDPKSIVTITQFTKPYFELASKNDGRWANFLSLDKPVLLKIDDQIVRIVPVQND